jgi:hypothetical protein
VQRFTGDRRTGRLLGVQLFGHRHAEIAKRIDIAATAIFHGTTVDASSDLDLSYTPPLGSPWDAVQAGAQAWTRQARSALSQQGAAQHIGQRFGDPLVGPAEFAGMTLNLIALVLLIAGIIWLALAVGPRAPRLALAGGVLSVFGLLVVLFENSVGAAAPAIVGALGRGQAAAVLDRIHSGAISALEPLSLVGDVGIALLGIAAVKAGAPRWAGAAIVIGAPGEGAGFATGTKALVIISFALLFAGLLPVVRMLATSSGSRVAARPAPAVAVS